MSIRFYHRDKCFAQYPFTKEKGEDYYLEAGNKLIVNGLKKGNNLGEQIIIYLALLDRLEKKKIYNIPKDDLLLASGSLLALWKLGVYDADCGEDPIWISPKYKRLKKIRS